MRLLLIDTCGEEGSLALTENGEVLRERTLPPRTASARLIAVIRAELETLGWSLQTLSAIAVVNGPGSFTGVRVGMAAAKGFCEVAALRLITVSRLELLLSVSDPLSNDLAVLDAGRGEFYVRSAAGDEESLMTRADLLKRAIGARLLLAEEKLLGAFADHVPSLRMLSAAGALHLVESREPGGDPVDEADANYVRQARALYAQQQVSVCEPEVR